MNSHPWIAERTLAFDSSGIRKVFDLASKLGDPINLSIGQPDFDVPENVKEAYIEAVRSGKNGYALTQGMPVLRDKLQARIKQQYGHDDRDVFVCSGTSGGLTLAMLSVVNPGDEVIVFDPFFVMYDSLVQLAGGVPVYVDTYPDFQIDMEQLDAAVTERTKLIVFNSPANPTGVVASREQIEALALFAVERNILLLSDEIYSLFCYDEAFVSPAEFNPQTLVIDGLSKSHAMTGWRLGWAHGPAALIETMIKLQQYSFVCAPQPAQWAGAVALDTPMNDEVSNYRQKRDRLLAGLEGDFDVSKPGGAFYAFPRAPKEGGEAFVHRAIDAGLLIIPGNIFSRHDTHFRISYAAADETIDRDVEVLQRLARG